MSFFVENLTVMCYRLSNTAKREVIENEFGALFKYPKLHKFNPIINGLEESFVSVITSKDPKVISYAIWGILPGQFEEDWEDFQNVQNTLNIDHDKIEDDPLFNESIKTRRCIIIVTGFFTYYLHKGELYPYYVHLSEDQPFALAGIYNQLKDGFITCGLILSEANSFISKIHNSNHKMPLSLDKEHQDIWLNEDTNELEIQNILNKSIHMDYHAHPIAKEFHKIGITYDSVLEPVYYKNIPKSS